MDDIKDIDIDDEKLNQSEATTSLYRKLSEQECVSSELILPVERLMITETRNVTRAVRNAENNY